MHDDFNPTSARDELDRLTAQKASLLAHCIFAIDADQDLNDQEKSDARDEIEQALDNAFFRSINSIEEDLWWHAASVNDRQMQADRADIRGRQ